MDMNFHVLYFKLVYHRPQVQEFSGDPEFTLLNIFFVDFQLKPVIGNHEVDTGAFACQSLRFRYHQHGTFRCVRSDPFQAPAFIFTYK